MITHIVMWKVKDRAAGLDKPEILQKFKRDLEALAPVIPEIVSICAGINDQPVEQAADVVLISTFANWAGLETYQRHPAHMAVVAFVREVTCERRVVDFES